MIAGQPLRITVVLEDSTLRRIRDGRFVVDILRLYDFIHEEFAALYQKYNLEANESGSKFGKRREVIYKGGSAFKLQLTGGETKYMVPDGWLYPVMASLPMLLKTAPNKPP